MLERGVIDSLNQVKMWDRFGTCIGRYDMLSIWYGSELHINWLIRKPTIPCENDTLCSSHELDDGGYRGKWLFNFLRDDLWSSINEFRSVGGTFSYTNFTFLWDFDFVKLGFGDCDSSISCKIAFLGITKCFIYHCSSLILQISLLLLSLESRLPHLGSSNNLASPTNTLDALSLSSLRSLLSPSANLPSSPSPANTLVFYIFRFRMTPAQYCVIFSTILSLSLNAEI